MDRERLRLLKERFHLFLTSQRSREAMVFLFFLLVSAAFWLQQTLNETYESGLRIPLQLINIPQGTVITTDLPEQITVTVRDKGTTLFGYFFNLRRDSLSIDFTAYDNGESSGHVMLNHAEVVKQLTPKLDVSSRIVSIRPDTLEYFFTRGVRKRVPVVFHGRIETDPLYFLADVQCKPDSVDVWAEPRLLDSLTYLPTVNTIWQGLRETTTQDVELQAHRGMKLDPSRVHLSAVVDVYVEKQVTVPIVGTNFPAGYTLRTFPPSATLSFRVGSMNFKNVTANNFVLTATYEELVQLPDSILHLQLRSVPEGVSQVRIAPEDVQFMIEMSDDD